MCASVRKPDEFVCVVPTPKARRKLCPDLATYTFVSINISQNAAGAPCQCQKPHPANPCSSTNRKNSRPAQHSLTLTHIPHHHRPTPPPPAQRAHQTPCSLLSRDSIDSTRWGCRRNTPAVH